MQRLFGWSALAGALLALATPAAAQDQPPVTIAPGNVTGEPKVSTRDFKGHKAWSMTWFRDAEGRELLIGFIEGLKLPYRDERMEMLEMMHDPSSPDEAELRQQVDGTDDPEEGL
jgi:hypothetical protein